MRQAAKHLLTGEWSKKGSVVTFERVTLTEMANSLKIKPMCIVDRTMEDCRAVVELIQTRNIEGEATQWRI